LGGKRWRGFLRELVLSWGGGLSVDNGERGGNARRGGSGWRGGGRGGRRVRSLGSAAATTAVAVAVVVAAAAAAATTTTAAAAAAARPAAVLLLRVLLQLRRLLLLLLPRRWQGITMHGKRHLLRMGLRATLWEGLLVIHGMLIIPLSTLIPLHVFSRWRRGHPRG